MIEKYNQINIFKPKKFAKLVMQGDDVLLENLQNFADFIAKQNDTNSYKISFSDEIGSDIARLNTGIAHKIKLPDQIQDIKELYNILINTFSIEEKTIIYKQNKSINIDRNIDVR